MRAEYNPTNCRWDRFRMFYSDLKHPFYALETGEILVYDYMSANDMLDCRRSYSNYNVSIWTSDDYKAKAARFLDPDGGLVLNTWLNDGGMQLLLVDHDTNIVVGLSHTKAENLPEKFQHLGGALRAVFPASGQPPIGGGVRVSSPKALTPEERANVASVRAACKAWADMSEEAKRLDGSFYPESPLNVAQPMALDFVAMVPVERLRLARHGVKFKRDVTYLSHMRLASNI